jgi:hypothetical protein
MIVGTCVKPEASGMIDAGHDGRPLELAHKWAVLAYSLARLSREIG